MNSPFPFRDLDINIIHYIFEFTGVICYRRGKYICKMQKEDERYQNLMKLPKPVRLFSDTYNLYLISKTTSVGYILNYKIDSVNNVIRLYVRFNRASNNYFQDNSKSIEWYIIPKTYSKWRRVISYNHFSS
jgi:hypothetical protein